MLLKRIKWGWRASGDFFHQKGASRALEGRGCGQRHRGRKKIANLSVNEYVSLVRRVVVSRGGKKENELCKALNLGHGGQPLF